MSNEVAICPRFLLYSSGFLCFVVQLLGNITNFWLKTGDDSGVFPISGFYNFVFITLAMLLKRQKNNRPRLMPVRYVKWGSNF
jgi:hypothetical protein